MKLTWLFCLALASGGVCQQNSTTAASGDFADAVQKATLPLVVTNEGDLSGTGGKIMADAIEKARFVLIGETHFSRETPQFAAAVCRTMRPDAYAVEAGPIATAYVQSIVQRPERKAAMQERERRFPANMAFLDDESENDLAAVCTASGSPKSTALWGLDQEFLGAATVLLQQMKKQPNGPRAEAAIGTAIERDRQAEARARSTGDFMQLFLASVSDVEFNNLQNAVEADGAKKSKRMMHEFAESRRIYRLNAAGSPDSNSERASFLKEHFSGEYRSLRERMRSPRILLKFGDNHMWKGFNSLHQLDLGDYVAEVASVEHAASLHIDVLAAKGSVAALGGYTRPTKTESFVLADIPEFAWLKPALAMLPVASSGSLTGVVRDLRKLRSQHLAMTTEEQHFAYGYDLIVLLPEFSPSDLYQ